MYRIAVCDDDIMICGELETIISNIGIQKRRNIDIDIFFTGEALCEKLEGGEQYDIVILDIELSCVNGIEVGKFIREDLNDYKTVIIYISGKDQYAMQLFKTRPYDFWIKPIQENEISHELGRMIDRIDDKMEYLEYRAGKKLCRVRMNEILYIQSDMRKIKIMTIKEEKIFYGNLSLLAKELPEYFIRIHKSYIINDTYAAEYTYDSVKMLNGETITISKPYRKIVREKLLSQRK